MSHEDTVRKLAKAVEALDGKAYATFFTEDGTLSGPLSPQPKKGRAEIEAGEQGMFASFSGIRVDFLRVMCSGDSVMAEILVHAKNTGDINLGGDNRISATGKSLELPEVWVVDFNADGLITQKTDYFDSNTFMSQLGLVSG